MTRSTWKRIWSDARHEAHEFAFRRMRDYESDRAMHLHNWLLLWARGYGHEPYNRCSRVAHLMECCHNSLSSWRHARQDRDLSRMHTAWWTMGNAVLELRKLRGAALCN